MFKLIGKPARYLFKIALETVVVGWAVQNRKAIMDRFRPKGPETADTTRPVGDRFVPINADRPPSPFEAAVADSIAPLAPGVEAHLEEAASHVRIDVK